MSERARDPAAVPCVSQRRRAARPWRGSIAAGRALLALAAIVLSAAPARAQVLVEPTPALVGLYNVYAPTVLGPRMWIGGWLTVADFPDDKIYRSDFVNGSWTFPVHSFEISTAGVNDPSVVLTPSGSLLMYFTRIAKDCAPQPNCYLSDNLTGVAVSADGGASWSDLGLLIGMDNGAGSCGAWAPSALVVGEEVWVYYHGGNPSFGLCDHPSGTVFLSRFDGSGRGSRGTVVVSVPMPAVNVDVSRRPGGGFVMVANSPDLTRIHRFVSSDGLAWTAAPLAPLVDAGTVWIPTPHVTWVDAGHFDLWFGSAVTAGSTVIQEVERWRWSE